MKRQTFLTGVLALSVVLAACGSQDATSTDTIAAVPVTPVETATPVDTTIETATPETTAPETTAPETTAPETTAPETTAPETTAPETTAPETTAMETMAALDADDPAAAASAAWSLVFDSTAPFDDKAPHLADAEALRPTVEAYSAAGGGFGGITLEPTAVEVAGELATITYDVNFGANPAYGDQTGTVGLVDGVWTVSRDEFCSFMASARVSCS